MTNIINGTNDPETLFDTADDDSISGLGGDDTVYSAAGSDTIDGGDGNDFIDVYGGSDHSVTGGSGDDIIVAFAGGSETIDGGSGNDYIIGLVDSNTLPTLVTGGDGNDSISLYSFGTAPVAVTGGAGSDAFGAMPLPYSDINITITDFASGPDGDTVDLSNALLNLVDYDGGNPLIEHYVRVVQDGANALVQVDLDGDGSAFSYHTTLILSGVDASTLSGENVSGFTADGSHIAGTYLSGDGTDNNLTGTVGDDTIDGGGGNDNLYGSYGNDSIGGGSGNDYLDGYIGDDTLFGGSGDDTIGDDFGHNTVYGEDGNDLLGVGGQGAVYADGGTGNDTFVGGVEPGADVVAVGGGGSDTYRLSYVRGEITITDFQAGDGGDVFDITNMSSGWTGYNGHNAFTDGYLSLVQSGADTIIRLDVDGSAGTIAAPVTLATLHNVTASALTAYNFAGFAPPVIGPTEGDDNLTGSAAGDTIDALGGNDTVFGLGGDDSITGGSGTDSLVGGDGNDSLDGGSGNDRLYGNGGNDTLQGGGGGDTLYGGAGDDVYYVDNVGDSIYEETTHGVDDGGYDKVISSISYTLGAHVEELDLIGTANITATGNNLDNYISGNAGANVLWGLGGNDTLDATAGGIDNLLGGDGDDVYIINNAATVITETNSTDWDAEWTWVGATLQTNVEEMDLLGSADIFANGNSGDNFLYGNSGNNILNGMAGSDTIYGNGGNDTLQGNVGADHMFGGTGDDYYYVDNAGDGVSEQSTPGIDDGGYDKVAASISYTLPTYVEELDLLGTSNINGTGNSGDNWIFGNAGNNVLTGLSGNDTLVGNGGIDTLVGGNGEDLYWVSNSATVITETNTTDWDAVWSSVSFTLAVNVEELDLLGSSNINGTGNAGDNFLYGNSGANQLSGLNGNDTLVGNGGNDTLTGGAGADSFVFAAASANGRDTIQDFVHGTDQLWFTGSDYGFATGHSLTSSEFTAGSAAVGTSGQFIWDAASHTLYWDDDGTGGHAAIAIATFGGGATVTAGDLHFG